MSRLTKSLKKKYKSLKERFSSGAPSLTAITTETSSRPDAVLERSTTPRPRISISGGENRSLHSPERPRQLLTPDDSEELPDPGYSDEHLNFLGSLPSKPPLSRRSSSASTDSSVDGDFSRLQGGGGSRPPSWTQRNTGAGGNSGFSGFSGFSGLSGGQYSSAGGDSNEWRGDARFGRSTSGSDVSGFQMIRIGSQASMASLSNTGMRETGEDMDIDLGLPKDLIVNTRLAEVPGNHTPVQSPTGIPGGLGMWAGPAVTPMAPSQRAGPPMGTLSKRLRDGYVLVVTARCPQSMQHCNWTFDDYSLDGLLWEGRVSAVYSAICSRSGLPVALKVYNKAAMTQQNLQHARREIGVHAQACAHKNIVDLYSVWEDHEAIYFVQELAEQGDMYRALWQRGGALEERSAVVDFIEPSLRAVSYLHSCGVVHRDIKPENLLVAGDGRILLTDFGLAVNTRLSCPVTRVGTLDYMAPEVLRCPDKDETAERPREGLYGNSVDVWALGVLAFECLVGSAPFAGGSREQTFAKIVTGEFKLPPLMSDEACDFIRRALSPEPGLRPTVEGMLEHEWIAKYVTNGAARPAEPAAKKPGGAPTFGRRSLSYNVGAEREMDAVEQLSRTGRSGSGAGLPTGTRPAAMSDPGAIPGMGPRPARSRRSSRQGDSDSGSETYVQGGGPGDAPGSSYRGGTDDEGEDEEDGANLGEVAKLVRTRSLGSSAKELTSKDFLLRALELSAAVSKAQAANGGAKGRSKFGESRSKSMVGNSSKDLTGSAAPAGGGGWGSRWVGPGTSSSAAPDAAAAAAPILAHQGPEGSVAGRAGRGGGASARSTSFSISATSLRRRSQGEARMLLGSPSPGLSNNPGSPSVAAGRQSWAKAKHLSNSLNIRVQGAARHGAPGGEGHTMGSLQGWGRAASFYSRGARRESSGVHSSFGYTPPQHGGRVPGRNAQSVLGSGSRILLDDLETLLSPKLELEPPKDGSGDLKKTPAGGSRPGSGEQLASSGEWPTTSGEATIHPAFPPDGPVNHTIHELAKVPETVPEGNSVPSPAAN